MGNFLVQGPIAPRVFLISVIPVTVKGPVIAWGLDCYPGAMCGLGTTLLLGPCSNFLPALPSRAMLMSGPKLLLMTMSEFGVLLQLVSLSCQLPMMLAQGPCKPYVEPCFKVKGPRWADPNPSQAEREPFLLRCIAEPTLHQPRDPSTGELALALIGEMTPALRKAVSIPLHGCRRAGSVPYLRRVGPPTQTDQLSFHPGTHPGFWVGIPWHLPHLWPARTWDGTCSL